MYFLVVVFLAVALSPEGTVCQRDPLPVAEGVLTVLPTGCNCLVTSQYNPVCGSDGNTYSSMQMLRCYQQCGFDLQFMRYGVCNRRKDVPT